MLGIKDIKKDPTKVETALKKKDPNVSISPVVNAYDEMCRVKTTLEETRSRLNNLSKQIGEKKRKGEDASDIMAEVSTLKEQSHTLNDQCTALETDFDSLLSMLPNLPDEDIKDSLDASENVCIKTVGKQRKFDFPVKNHLELGEIHGLFDFKRGAKLSGTGWPVYKGMGARLEWALINLMIDTHIENGFTFHLLPPSSPTRDDVWRRPTTKIR